MSKTKKEPKRQVNFADAVRYLSQLVDERADAKFLENSKQITMPIASLKTRVEVLEDLLMEKFGETPASLSERVLTRVEKSQGFEQVDSPVVLGSIVRVKVKEEISGTESPNNEMTDAFMVVGQNQIHQEIDKMLIGAAAGDTRSIVLPHPTDTTQSLKVTAFLVRVFKGRQIANEEVKAEVASETNETAPVAASEPQAAQS